MTDQPENDPEITGLETGLAAELTQRMLASEIDSRHPDDPERNKHLRAIAEGIINVLEEVSKSCKITVVLQMITLVPNDQGGVQILLFDEPLDEVDLHKIYTKNKVGLGLRKTLTSRERVIELETNHGERDDTRPG